MRIFLVLFLAVFSFAATKATLISTQGKEGVINKKITTGTSGVVLCPYMNKKIICARAVAFGNRVGFFDYAELKNDAFALPVVAPKKGDEIIFGKNYDRILIIAPNQAVYLKVKAMFPNKTVVSPDVMAAFLTDEPTKGFFINFAKKMDIGMYVFAIGRKVYEVDAFSFYAVGEKKLSLSAPYKKAFFVYFDNFFLKPVNYLKMIRGINAK
jgi:hypothetical protein